MKNVHRRVVVGVGTFGLVLPVLLLAGCSTPEVARKDPVLSGWNPQGVAAPAAPRSVAEKPLPPALQTSPLASPPVAPAVPAVVRTLPTDIIEDLDLADEADVATILRVMAKSAGINMMVSPRVSGLVTFSFRDIPWDQAFRGVIASAGLHYTWEGDVLRILTIEDMKHELEMEKVLKDRETVRAELRMVEPMAIQVIPIRYAKARAIGATLRTLLAGVEREGALDLSPRSTVSVDEENNAIIIHANPSDMDKAIALAGQLDRPKPQIHIEARIVEASRDAARQLGVQWGIQNAVIKGGRLFTIGGPGSTVGGFNSDFPGQFLQGGEAPVGFSMGLITEKIGGSELLSMQLSALQRKGRIHILSSPSITTLDNEAAVIESGEERAYRKTTGTGNILDVSLEWKKAVLKLEVTPQVVDGEYLRVEIIANKDSFDETKPQTNNEFPVNTKHARTTVLLRDGDTVVIGGLSLESSADTETGIPFLMDIPGLGYLFKNKSTGRKFDETLIFITPKIIIAVK